MWVGRVGVFFMGYVLFFFKFGYMKELVLFLRRLVMLFIAFIFGGIVGVGWLFGVSIILVLLGVCWSFHRIDKLIKLEKDEEII
jgi:hypothetical protein